MSSARKIASSRANGAKSRGPITPEGKRRSSMNAVRHGLLAHVTLLDNECPEAFEDFCRHYHEDLEPGDSVEVGLVEELTAAFWRLRRLWTVEKATLQTTLSRQPGDNEQVRLARAYQQAYAEPHFANLPRYEAHLHLMYRRALKNLHDYRAAKRKKAAEPQPAPVVPSPMPAGTASPEAAGAVRSGAPRPQSASAQRETNETNPIPQTDTSESLTCPPGRSAAPPAPGVLFAHRSAPDACPSNSLIWLKRNGTLHHAASNPHCPPHITTMPGCSKSEYPTWRGGSRSLILVTIPFRDNTRNLCEGLTTRDESKPTGKVYL